MNNPMQPIDVSETGVPILGKATVAEMSPNFASEILNVDDDLAETFRQQLLGKKRLGYQKDKETGKITEVWVETTGKPIINQRGFKELPMFINTSLNKIVPRSNLPKDKICLMCKEFEKNLIIKMINDYDKWGLSVSNVPQLVSGITWLIFTSLCRAEDGGTMAGITKGFQIVEHVNKDETKRSLLPKVGRR